VAGAVLKGEIYQASLFAIKQARPGLSQAATGRHACSDFATTLLLQAASMKSGKLLKSDPEEPGRR
jgi:alpha-D-ribose 1-methylphosphonate 5-triphosphate synthase subunit PhnH